MCTPSLRQPACRPPASPALCTIWRVSGSLLLAEHPRAPQVPMRAGARLPVVASAARDAAATLRRCDLAVPVRPPMQICRFEIDVAHSSAIISPQRNPASPPRSMMR